MSIRVKSLAAVLGLLFCDISFTQRFLDVRIYIPVPEMSYHIKSLP